MTKPHAGRGSAVSPNMKTPGPNILLVVEGVNDIQFLRRISRILHTDNPALPDLAAMEQAGELIFLPFGGGDLSLWAERLAGLGRAEFHLFDREMPPETASRRRIAGQVNRRPNCRAVVTSKRTLENFLHPEAIHEASRIRVTFGDFDDVADLVAQQSHARLNGQVPWNLLPQRTRRRRCNRAKKWLNKGAVERMTVERLAERDPRGEVRSWLATIARLANGSSQ